jgi:hypothetical protein
MIKPIRQFKPVPPPAIQFHPVAGELERMNVHDVENDMPITDWRFNRSMFPGLGVFTFLVQRIGSVKLAKYRMFIQLPLSEEEIVTIARNTCDLFNMKDGCV